MQNLAIGLVLIGLALLVGAVLLVYQFGPDLGVSPAPSMELKEPEDDDPTIQVTIGGDRNVEEINADARRRLSLEHVQDVIDAQPRGLTRGERESMDDRHRFAHVVRKGETLSSLAREYLGDEKLWPAIMDANPSLARPEDLREGETIQIPTRDAK
jgi:nucleoid-associated protein YgaU